VNQTEATRQVAQQWFDAMTSGQIDKALALLDDDVEWINYQIVPHFNDSMPWIGTVRGPAEVLRTFKIFVGVADVLGEELVKLVCDGDEAMGVVRERSRIKATQQEFEIVFIQEITVANGRIVRWKSYTDPSSIERAILWHDDERLLDRVRARDLDGAAELLKLGASASARDPASGLTLLMLAAGQGDAAMVRLLLDRGADLFAVDAKGGASALHKAIQGGSLECVKLLMEAGAFVDWAACTTGHTPLMDAFWFKFPDIVAYLLEHNAGLNMGTHYGFTFRQHIEFELKANAEGRDRLEQAVALVDQRDARDKERAARQALMAAVVAGDLAVVRRLLAAGAVVDERYPFFNGFNDDHTPLLVACRDGHTEIVGELLRAGADVNAVEPTFGAVPLHKAVYNGHADITGLLVGQAGVDLDFQGITNGYTPLHDALWHGYEDCARLLLGAGARLDPRGHDGKRPLDIAVDSFGAEHPLTREIAERTPA
jgi:ankyrin repeat protein